MTKNFSNALLFRCLLCNRTQLGIIDPATKIIDVPDSVNYTLRKLYDVRRNYGRACNHFAMKDSGKEGYFAGPFYWHPDFYEIVNCPRNVLVKLSK